MRIVVRMVDVEGPVHIDEVVRRIRVLWGLGRAGNRIRDAIHTSIRMAKRTKAIASKGSFLWPVVERAVPVRRRQGDPLPRIDLICDEEIAQAVRAVLQAQYATVLNDLVTQSSRVLGIRSTSEQSRSRIHGIIRRMIKTADLVMDQNGMVDLTAEH